MAINAVTVIAATTLSTAITWLLFYLIHRKQLARPQSEPASLPPSPTHTPSPSPTPAPTNATEVGAFYDATHDAFLQVYGDVIQAFRTRDLAHLLHHEARAMQLQAGMRLLDAGCGVCGPALFFAEHYGVAVDAVTASATQAAAAQQRITAAGRTAQVTVRQGDYHELASIFPAEAYDVVYFLESFGHSPAKDRAIAAAWHCLKPGGMLYVKDLFVKIPAIPAHAEAIRANVARINEAYRYNVGELGTVLDQIRRQGFILSAARTIDIPLEDFENLTISNDFQELTGIHRIDNLQEYIFPVDFFELVCIKPWYGIEQGNSRYFLQNLYYLQVTGKPL